MHIHGPDASLTLHLAAPLEFAVAPLPHRALNGVVPSSAAEQVAAVDVRRGAVTRSTLRTHRAHGIVPHAIIGRVLQIHQVVSCGDADLGVAELQATAAVHADLRGTVVFVPKIVAWNKNST